MKIYSGLKEKENEKKNKNNYFPKDMLLMWSAFKIMFMNSISLHFLLPTIVIAAVSVAVQLGFSQHVHNGHKTIFFLSTYMEQQQ